MSLSTLPQPINAFGDNFKGKGAQVTAGARGEGAAMIRRLGLGVATVATTTRARPSPRRGLRFAQIGAPNFVAALALVTALLVNGAAKAAVADEAIILGIEKDMAAAQTLDGVVATWDKDVVWYDINPGEVDGIAAVRAGITAADIARAENDVFRRHGLGDYVTDQYTRVRGHGVGLFADSKPHILEDVTTRIDAGMTLIVHPNTYHPVVGYMVLGDVVVATESGCEVLTATPRQLFGVPA